ncbi:TraB/GumN family protein [Massilia sp. Se16.2.3]|uniref:TraB/GumN family protein n=1 Tax=Massilia sp. Se16.2.3 TaxID=2709303 RepID=UPI0016028F67|nr:TraB/GumN family protein [Massilia sp. Se16.2.3]QNA97876.1 TraB/GumN family protein [Massilia sp. Se16.2.3]
MLVSGSRPGPGLWKVSKGEHVLWVFGTYSPLPAKMEWQSRAVERIIAHSQEYLKPPEVSVDVGWSGVAALPFLIGAKKNPDGRELRDILPPELYARWLPLKEKYFAGDQGVERERPSFVADELYSRALRHAGLSRGDEVRKRIGELAEKHHLKFTDASYHVTIKQPVKALREFKKSSMDDVPCLARTIDSLDTDVDVMRTRANAWAVGDLDEIRKLSFADRTAACSNALGTSSVATLQPELKDMHARAAEQWVAAAEKALATNASTFTVVHIKEILHPHGVIATLQARGYTVEPPK